MGEVEVAVVDETVDVKETKPFMEAARKVLLASIGAVALAQEEVEEFVSRLVERGEIAEKDGRKLVKEMMERRRQKVGEARESAGSELDSRLEALLHRMNVPSRRDVEALDEKITLLSQKVDALQRTQAAGPDS